MTLSTRIYHKLMMCHRVTPKGIKKMINCELIWRVIIPIILIVVTILTSLLYAKIFRKSDYLESLIFILFLINLLYGQFLVACSSNYILETICLFTANESGLCNRHPASVNGVIFFSLAFLLLISCLTAWESLCDDKR